MQVSPSLYPLPQSFVNSVFIFIKPLARTEPVVSLVRGFLAEKGFIITGEGVMRGITENLFDEQYPRLSRFSLMLKPNQLDLSPIKYIRFQKKFSTSWVDALESNRILNAIDAAKALNIHVFDLHELWIQAVAADNILKLDRGIYCGLMKYDSNNLPIFCLNGFYPSIRTRYTAPESFFHFFQVDWMSYLMNWSSFLENVIGREYPNNDNTGTLKSLILSEWNSLEIKVEPNYIYNCVHVSQSAFEAAVECSMWLSQPLLESTICKKMISSGIPAEIIAQWSRNPIVDGQRVFERMKDRGTDDCVSIGMQLWQSIKPLTLNVNSFNQLTPYSERKIVQNYSINRSQRYLQSSNDIQSSLHSPEIRRDNVKYQVKKTRGKKKSSNSSKVAVDRSDGQSFRIISI